MASANGSSSPTPTEQVRALYEQLESQVAQAGERFVGSEGFTAVLGQVAENTAALTKLSADAMDLVLRNLRVAGRRDIVRLARQLARTEDKLERVLQEVEELRDELVHEGRTLRERRSDSSSGRSASRSSPARAAGASDQES
jgi:hypothetical protein